MTIQEARYDTDTLRNMNRVTDEIRRLQLVGDLEAATKVCVEATHTFPNQHFFSKIQSDLCFLQKDYESSFIALGDFLSKIPASNKLIADFAQRYHRLQRAVPSEKMSKLAEILYTIIDQSSIDQVVIRKVKEIIRLDITSVKSSVAQPQQLAEFSLLLRDDSKLVELAKLEKKLEVNNKRQLEQVLDDHILTRARGQNTYRVDLYCASLYENQWGQTRLISRAQAKAVSFTFFAFSATAL